MKHRFFILFTMLSASHVWAQSISPGGIYAASASGSANGVSVTWVLGNLNTFAELSALPVRLISFEARLTASGHAELQWKTAEELNNLGFEIQKSTDAKKWELLAWVDGAKNSNTAQSYRFVDETFNTTSYYRLRQVDFDDSYTYSKIISLIHEKESLDRFVVYPNPSRQNKISLVLPEKTQRVFLYDQLGNKLVHIESPASETSILLPNPGSFIIQIETPVGRKGVRHTFQ
ncbi:T9SS type A sorting domain-containing protein [Dyadobacter fermentans]|nr:T9SS type A sorting domain-containing protein [Dyadobacter fermentans]